MLPEFLGDHWPPHPRGDVAPHLLLVWLPVKLPVPVPAAFCGISQWLEDAGRPPDEPPVEVNHT